MMNIIISTLNAKYIHTSLSIRYLKAYAQPDYEVQLAEYTIKDPIMNIVGDLHSKNLMSSDSAVISGISRKR